MSRKNFGIVAKRAWNLLMREKLINVLGIFDLTHQG